MFVLGIVSLQTLVLTARRPIPKDYYTEGRERMNVDNFSVIFQDLCIFEK